LRAQDERPVRRLRDQLRILMRIYEATERADLDTQSSGKPVLRYWLQRPLDTIRCKPAKSSKRMCTIRRGPWNNVFMAGETTVRSSLCSFSTFPVRFGILGLVVAFLVSCWATFLRSLYSFNHPRTETFALLGMAAVAIPGALLATPFEDKGFTLGLTLVLALALPTYRPRAHRREWDEHAALVQSGP
jgi:hypothetical protein